MAPQRHQSGPFVGRERELELLEQWFDRGGRLITVMGPPGAGKTRLATHFASTIPDALTFRLAEVTDPSQLVTHVGSQLELTGQIRPGDIATAIEERGHRLVMLDNAEHLVGAVDDLVSVLLESCDALAIIVTSRSRLQHREERVLDLRGLSTDTVADSEGVGLSLAAQCFVTRARMADLTYEPAVSEHEAIEELVRCVDGIPLAIELAAGRIRLMSVSEITQRIQAQIGVLGRGTSVDSRHRTIRAAGGWSWALLEALQIGR